MISAFEHVPVLLFVTDISRYDELLPKGQTHVSKALELFDEICNSKFPKTPIILLLNNTDQFKEKLSRTPLHLWFPRYTGGADYSCAMDYVLSRFVSLNQFESRGIYTHFLKSENDSTCMTFLMAAVHDILIQANLRESKKLVR